VLLLIVGSAWATRIALPRWRLIDLDSIWFAGRLWNEGFNPYGAAFESQRPLIFGDEPGPIHWCLPPHTWTVSAPLGLLERETAWVSWNLLGLATAVGSAAVAGVVARGLGLSGGLVTVALLLLLCAMSATQAALLVGQLSFVLLAGVALFALGLVRRRDGLVALGVTLLLLKPQIGAVMLAMLIACPGRRRAAAMTIGLVGLLSVPALAIGGPEPTIRGFLTNITGYQGAIAFNLPENMTGLGHWLAAGLGLPAPASILAPLALVAGPLLLRAALRRTGARDEAAEASAIIVLGLGTIAFFIPMHVYDLVLLAPFPAFLWPLRGRLPLLLTAASVPLLMRPENLHALIGLGTYTSFASLGCALLFAAAVTATLGARARSAPSSAVG
jgi:hypothetical protein